MKETAIDALCAVLYLGAWTGFAVGLFLGMNWLLWKSWMFVVVDGFHGPPLSFWQVFVLSFMLWVAGNLMSRSNSTEVKVKR